MLSYAKEVGAKTKEEDYLFPYSSSMIYTTSVLLVIAKPCVCVFPYLQCIMFFVITLNDLILLIDIIFDFKCLLFLKQIVKKKKTTPDCHYLKSPVHRIGFISANSYDIVAFIIICVTLLFVILIKLICICRKKVIPIANEYENKNVKNGNKFREAKTSFRSNEFQIVY